MRAVSQKNRSSVRIPDSFYEALAAGGVTEDALFAYFPPIKPPAERCAKAHQSAGSQRAAKSPGEHGLLNFGRARLGAGHRLLNGCGLRKERFDSGYDTALFSEGGERKNN